MRKTDAGNFLSNLFGKRSISPQAAHQMQIQSALLQTRSKIDEGLAKPLASTGTPIANLSGMAKTLAMKANLGGGSIATGGRGVRGGDELLNQFSQLTGMAKENYIQNKLNNGGR